MTITLSDLSVRYNRKHVLRNIGLTVHGGQWLMIVGPNGAGKSTVVSAISQEIPYTGTCSFNGIDLKTMKHRERARITALLRQKTDLTFDFSVREVIEIGFYANGTVEPALLDFAMELTDVKRLERRSVRSLSGGEVQRVLLAKTIAQDPAVLLLDEPTTHLDIFYKKQLFDILSRWLNDQRAIISVVHELGAARTFGTHAAVMQDGTITAFGTAQTVLSPEFIGRTFNVSTEDIEIYG